MKPLGYVLIGCGDCGRRKHLEAYRAFPDEVKVLGVFDVNQDLAQETATTYKIPRVYPTLKAIWQDPAVDMVSVVTPNKFHAEIAIAALAAGKHVHIEKPIAMTAGEAERIVAAKRAANRQVMVGLNNRFLDSSLYLKSVIDTGRLGEIYHARCGWIRRRGIPQWGGWFTQKSLAGGGPVIDLGVHVLDLTLHFMGQPTVTHVTATTAAPQLAAMGFGDAAMEEFSSGFLRCATGASIAFELSWASHIEREVVFVELLGTRSGLRYTMYDFATPEITFFTHDGATPLDTTAHMRNTCGWGENETRHFLGCLRDGIAPSASAEEAVNVMHIVDAIYASASQGREVEIAKPAVL